MRASAIAVLVGYLSCLPLPALAAEASVVRDGYLELSAPAARIPLAALPTAQLRGRATKKGAIAGAVAGGLVLGLLGAVATTVACEGTCTGSEWIAGAAVGGVVGAAGGAAAGALLGAAIPDSGPTGVPRTSRDGPIGSLSLGFGYDKALDSIAPDGGTGERVALVAELGTWAPGFEIGRHRLGRRSVVGAYGQNLEYDESLVYFGPTLTFLRRAAACGLTPSSASGPLHVERLQRLPAQATAGPRTAPSRQLRVHRRAGR